MRSIRKRRSTIVLDLGRGSVKLAAAESAGDAVRFSGITRVPLPGAGRERAEADPAEIGATIGAVVEQRGWKEMPAACLLSGSATSTQSFLFPPMPWGEMRQAIALKLGQTLHFELASAHFDHRCLREGAGSKGQQVLTLVAAARAEAIAQAVTVMRLAGLRPVTIGAAAESLANLVYYANLCREGEAIIHVDIDAWSTILNLFDGRLLRFTREIDIAGENFTQALMRPIITARGAVHLTHEQAREVKEACGYPREDEDLALPHSVRSSEVLPLLEPVAHRLTGEIRRSIDYLCALLERLRVDRILLSGSGGRLRNLDRLLAEELGVPVTFTDPVASARAHWRLAVSDAEQEDLVGFAAILGYSLGHHQPINLLPLEEKSKQAARRVSRVRSGVGPGALALGLGLAGTAVSVDRTYGRAVDMMRQTAAEVDERLRREQELARSLAAARQAAEPILAARGAVPDWVGTMKELSQVFPAEARITTFSAERSESGPLLRFEASIVPGAALDRTVSELTTAMAASPFFRNLRVVNASRVAGEGDGRFLASVELVAASRASWEAEP